MASDTIVDFKDRFCFMHGEHVIGLMIMTGVTVVIGIGLCVAGFASDLTFVAVVEGEGVAGQQSRCPGFKRVTAGAVEAKLIDVDIWLFMTG